MVPLPYLRRAFQPVPVSEERINWYRFQSVPNRVARGDFALPKTSVSTGTGFRRALQLVPVSVAFQVSSSTGTGFRRAFLLVPVSEAFELKPVSVGNNHVAPVVIYHYNIILYYNIPVGTPNTILFLPEVLLMKERRCNT